MKRANRTPPRSWPTRLAQRRVGGVHRSRRRDLRRDGLGTVGVGRDLFECRRVSRFGSPFEPASASAMPSVVSAAGVPRANALIAATSSAGYLVGPLLGGAVLGIGASPAVLFVVDAGTFVASALLVASIRRPFGRGSTQEHP